MPFEPLAWDAWEDLRFPAQGLNPPGAPADATPDPNTGALSFAGNADNVIVGIAQMPHRWNAGTGIRPHIHLRFPTSASGKNTRWKLEYDIANVNGDFTNNSGTFTDGGTITVENPANVKKHVIASFNEINMTGFTDSCIILWKISRLASSDAADNDTNAAHMLEFDIHYRANNHGTFSEFGTSGIDVL